MNEPKKARENLKSLTSIELPHAARHYGRATAIRASSPAPTRQSAAT